ncbi:MAG: oligosaccharide flippase family protein, partial [Microbispora sp.]|nr:oligosaccharide flippase family protein [Microbispora sp.]
DKLTKANLAGVVANAAIAIALAAAGAGAYSFAAGQFGASVVTGVLVLAYARVPFRIAVDRQIAVRLLRFGLPLAASLGLESVLMNADYIIVGDHLGMTALGFYLLAFNVSSWVPGLIGTAIRYVSIAGFSRLAEGDQESLTEGVRRSVPLLVAFVLPVAVVMATLAHAIIITLYGAEWNMSAGVLRFLAVLMVVRMLTSLAFDILTSVGATRATVWLNAGWAAALVAALLAGVELDGIRGAAIAHAVVGLFVALPLAAWALRRSGVNLRPALPGLVRPLAGAVVAAVVILLVRQVTQGILLLELIVAGGAGMLVYVLIVVPRAQLRELSARLARLV